MELVASGKKLTKSEKPVVSICCKDKNGKVSVIRKFRFAVKETKKLKAKAVKVNKGDRKLVSIPVEKSIYDFYTKKLVFNYSKKGIADVKLGSMWTTELFGDSRYRVKGYYAKGLKLGKTKVTVYEKKNSRKIKVGSFTLKVKKAKMSEVLKQDLFLNDNDDWLKLSYGESKNLKEYVENTFMRLFKKNEYTISFKPKNPKYFSINKSGVVKCVTKTNDDTYINAKIKFTDGSAWAVNIYFSIKD